MLKKKHYIFRVFLGNNCFFVAPPSKPKISWRRDGDNVVVEWSATANGGPPLDKYTLQQVRFFKNNIFLTFFRTQLIIFVIDFFKQNWVRSSLVGRALRAFCDFYRSN